MSPPWKSRTRSACAAIRKLNFDARRGAGRPAGHALSGRRGAGRPSRDRRPSVGISRRSRRARCNWSAAATWSARSPPACQPFALPPLSLDAMMQLLSAAFIIALVAFMESISMAKALAAQTKQRLDPNQELIGQGLANIGGSFFQAYPGLRLLHRLGHQPPGRRQDRLRHGLQRPVRRRHPAVPDALPLPPAQGRPWR